jgi:putative PIN family toxin of toxin-antitoxin system
MIVVLDTNVLVAGLLKPFGPSAAVVRLAVAGRIRIAQDYRILSEYRDVLLRAAFGFDLASVDALLVQLEEDGLAVTPPPTAERLSDPTDAPFWEAAEASRAEALITGNKRHFPLKSDETRVLSPSEFLEAFGFGG